MSLEKQNEIELNEWMICYLNIFQWNNSFRNIFRCVFKVIETPIAQDKPSPLPTLPTERNKKKWIKLFDKMFARNFISKISYEIIR
jgi:hypothetical protein